MKYEAKIGDIFLIPVSESVVGVGQVIDVLAEEIYIVIFAETWNADDPLDFHEIDKCTPLFSSLTMDAKIWNGDWKIIGNNKSNVANIAKPRFKIIISGSTYVESYKGDNRRPASEDEIELLRNRKTVAPIRLEKALRSKLGLLEWNSAYDDLYYSYAKLSDEIGL